VSKLAPQSCTRACRNGAEWAKDQKVDFHLQPAGQTSVRKVKPGQTVTNCKVSLTQAYSQVPLSFCLLLACRPH
jgi:hypothetical protein